LIKDSREIASRTFYSLSVPNKEVSIGFNDYLVRMFFANGTDATAASKLSQKIFRVLSANQPELLEEAFFTFFSGIPYKWYVKNNIAEYEGYYCSVFYSFLAALGLTIKPEDMTNKGRIDFTVVMDKGIFIFEIKMKSSPQNAIEQIKEKKYHEKYLMEGKEIFLVGIEFNEKDKNLSKFETENITRQS